MLIEFLIRVVCLGNATLHESPRTYLTSDNVYNHIVAAIEASTDKISPELLLSIAWTESRYSPYAVSRIERGKRRGGIPSWVIPPRNTRSFFCGITQASAGDSWKKCMALRDIRTAYKVTVIELNKWLAPRICNGDLTCALNGYSGGFPAIKLGNHPYANYVLNRAKRISILSCYEGVN